MRTIVETLKSLVIYITCLSLLPLNSFADTNAGMVVDSSAQGNNVVLDKAANGVPLLNINNPNSAGVSHNQFIDFNVDQKGVVINNSTHQGTSIIGGAVLANPNLKQSADIIINEVTSTNPSLIEGPTEIFGKRADYILANPNGISVNGGEFIGTKGLTITTGVPITNSLGELEKIVVESGSVSFFGKDLNYKNMDYFDVVTKAAKLNAKIHANSEARIVTGTNSYNYKTKSATPITSRNGANKTSGFAIDTGNLGGLYAGRISMVSTEDGVGVNVGDIASMSGDIEITANGDIIHKDIRSSGALNVTSKNGDIYLTSGGKSNEVSAQKEIRYNAFGKISNNGLKVVSDSISGIIFNAGSIRNNGIISARFGGMKFSTSGDIENNGVILALHSITANSNGVFTNAHNGLVNSKKGDINLRVKSYLENIGVIKSEDNNINVSAGDIYNRGLLGSYSLVKLHSSGVIINQNPLVGTSNSLIKGQSVDIHADGDILNNSKIISNQNLNITSNATIKSTGDIIAVDDISFLAEGKITNTGIINSTRGYINAYSTSSSIYNSNSIDANGSISLDAALDIENHGLLKSQDSVLAKSRSGWVFNYGNILVDKSLEIESALGVLNQEKILSSNIVLNSASDFINKGELSSMGFVRMALGGDFINEGKASAASLLRIDSRNLSNRGEILSQGVTVMKFTESMENMVGASIESANDANIVVSGSVINDGEIKSSNVLDIDSGAAITNSGQFLSGGKKVIVASDSAVTNDGTIGGIAPKAPIAPVAGTGTATVSVSGNIGYLKIHSVGDFINHGTATSKGADEVEIHSATGITNSGLIESQSLLKLDADILDNSLGTITSDGMMIVNTTSGLINMSGHLESKKSGNVIVGANVLNDGGKILFGDSIAGSSLISVSSIDNGSGSIRSLGALQVEASVDVKNGAGGDISAQKDLTVGAIGDISNAGSLQSNSDMKLTSATGNIETSGSIVSAAKLSLEAMLGRFFVSTGSNTQSKDAVTISSKSISGDGGILSDSGIKIASDSAFTNELNISTKGKVEITVANGDFVNKKLVHGEDGAKVSSLTGAIVNEAVISANGVASSLEAASGVINRGEIKGKTAELRISSPNQTIENLGKINIEGKIKTTSAVLDNIGEFNADQGGSINAAMEVRNTGTLNHYNGSLEVDTLKLYNDGTLAGKHLIVGANTVGEINNAAKGVIFTTDTMALNSTSLINNAAGNAGILSTGSIEGKFTGDVRNDGLIFAKTNLKIESSGGKITNNKEINSAGTMALAAANDVTNSARIIAKDAMTLTSGTKLVNSSDLLSTGAMDITAPNLENKGHLGSSKKLTTRIANDLTNRGTIEGGGIEMRVGGIINNDRHNIQSIDDITITDLAGGKVRKISNVAGIIGSTKGNVNISAKELYQPARLNIKRLTEQDIKDGKEIPIAAPNVEVVKVHEENFDVRGDTITTTTKSDFHDEYKGQSDSATIYAGKDLNLGIDRIYSKGSEIRSVKALSSVSIVDAETLYKHKLTQVDTYKKYERSYKDRDFWGSYTIEWEHYFTDNKTELTVETTDLGTIGLKASGKNITIKPLTYNPPNASNIKAVAPTASVSHTPFLAAPAKALAPSAPKGPGQITLSIDDLRQKLADMKAKFPNAPVSFDHGTHSDPRIAAAFEAAKWPEDPAPGNYYIQEKSVVFTDPAAYFGTEDFIKRIPGYNPNQEAAYMGDPIKQNEFIMRQMMDMKGFATMYAGEDPAEMIKRMYENAEEEARDLELRPGLVMTAAQVASLKKDMIWPENIKLADGNLVTVPRVYLAHSRPTEKGLGIRAAETVDIEDEDLVIGDKISAKNIRLASTNGSITVLAGAKVNAKESAELSSASNTNLAGTVVAQSIKSHSANATNITGTISGGNILLTAGTDVTNSGLINASHNLSIEAVRDVMNLGGKIESEGDAQVIAGQNFVQETEVTRHGSGHNYYDTMGEKPELSIAGHLAVATGGDYIDIGSVTKAGSVKENVGGNRLIGSAVLEREVSYGFSSKSYYKAHDITNIGSSYEVVGSIDSHVGGDVAILGSKVNAGSDISYDVGGDVHVASLVDVRHEEGASTRTSSRWYGGKNTKSTSFTNHSEELVRAGIESGGRTKVRSSGDHAYIGSDLASKDGTRLEGHDISFLTQDTSNAGIKSTSSRGTFWQSSHNQGSSGTKVNEGTVSGPLSVDASGSVVVEVRAEGSKLEGKLESINAEITHKSDESSSWDKKQRGLTPEGTMLVSAAMGLATAGTSLGVFESTLLTNFTTGTINNGGNLGKGLKAATSEDSLKGAFKAWAGAELTKGIVGSLGPDDMPGLKGLDKALAITQQEVIRAGVNGIMNGQDLGSIIKAGAFNAALANVQNKIGDLGEAHGIGGTLQDGGFAKTALHAAAGGAFSAASGGSFTSGAVGGAASEQVSAHLAPNDPAASQKIALVAQTASALAGGDASDMGVASKVATSGHEYNMGMAPRVLGATTLALAPEEMAAVLGLGVGTVALTTAPVAGPDVFESRIGGGGKSASGKQRAQSSGSGGSPDPGKGGGGNNLAKVAATTAAAKATTSSKGKNLVQKGGKGGNLGSGSSKGSTAREVVAQNPHIARKYVKEVESITGRKVPGKQVAELKDAIKGKDFKKLDQGQYNAHRKEWDSKRDFLRKEWERETGQKWPKYKEFVYKDGKQEVKNRPYDAHHVVKVDHGGPNTWWNIHPATPKEHGVIHGTGSAARKIFDAGGK